MIYKSLLTLCLLVMMTQVMQAHVMVAQHATLRFHAKGVYFLASYPVSSFQNIDDNNDGLVNQAELKKHYQSFTKQVRQQVQLTEDGQIKELEGLLLNLSHSHHHKKAVSHIIVMGRFKSVTQGVVSFTSKLFGSNKTEQQFKVRITRYEKPIEVVMTPLQNQINISQLMFKPLSP